MSNVGIDNLKSIITFIISISIKNILENGCCSFFTVLIFPFDDLRSWYHEQVMQPSWTSARTKSGVSPAGRAGTKSTFPSMSGYPHQQRMYLLTLDKSTLPASSWPCSSTALCFYFFKCSLGLVRNTTEVSGCMIYIKIPALFLEFKSPIHDSRCYCWLCSFQFYFDFRSKISFTLGLPLLDL